MAERVYCDDCVHCRPDKSLLSFFGLLHEDAMSDAKRAAKSKHSRVALENCYTQNRYNDCPLFQAKP